ncbi:MAG: NAD-dependent epimerase/dehydratase family protein [Candidatus Zixiibacteriota bacterium]
MNALILGGTRFIGLATVKRLSELGCDVTVFHRGQTSNPLPSGVREITGERAHLGDFRDQFAKVKPDVVIDMIALTEADGQSLVDVFKGIAGRVVVISSCDVYRSYGRLIGTEPGPPEPMPLTEDSPLREKLFPYRGKIERLHDYDKILVERAVMGHSDLPATVLRLPMVYGPRDYQRRIFPYLKRMDDGREFILIGKKISAWRGCRAYVGNVADAIVMTALDPRAARQIYNVAEPETLTEREWVDVVGLAAGWSGEILPIPDDSLPAHLRDDSDLAHELVVDSSRIRVELGYSERVSRIDAVRTTVEWDRANPPAEVDPAQFDYAAEDETARQFGPKP